MLWSFEDRQDFLKKNRGLCNLWVTMGFQSPKIVGSIPVIVRKAQQAHGKLTRETFGKFYLSSGDERLDVLNGYVLDKDSINLQNGRTMEELLKKANDFAIMYSERFGEKLDIDVAENIMFINVFDNSFSYYKNLVETVLSLKSQFKDMDILVSKTDMFLNFGIDILVYKDDIILKAIYIDYQEDDLIKQKHDSFERIYGILPEPNNHF